MKKYAISISAAAAGVLALGAILTACGSEANKPAASPVPSPGGNAQSSNAKTPEGGMPIAGNEKITLKIAAGNASGNAPDWNQVAIWQDYEAMTNMHIQWEMIPLDNMKEKRNLLLASGDYPDAFFTAQVPNTELIKYGSQGTFIKLNELIDKYAPNLKKLLDENPDLKKGVTMPDGSIYSFPLIYDPKFVSVLATNKVWLQKDWMDKLGLQPPETTDDFYRVLKAFKEGDPNGNGQADEIPFGGANILGLTRYLSGAWGLMNRGTRHPYVDIDPATNELRFIPTDPKYKELLMFEKKLYDEKLINEDIFTIQGNQYNANAGKGIYGSMPNSNPNLSYNLKGYVGANALKGPHGDRMYNYLGSGLVDAGAFVITNKNKHPEETVRWIDYFYSEEGQKLFFMGIEGKSYEVQDGKVQYTKEITENPNGLTLAQAIIKYTVWIGGYYPGVVSEKYFQGGESTPAALEATENFMPYVTKELWPSFTYTLEETDQLGAISTDITNYITEMQAKFVTGKASFDEWDNYTATFQKMKLDVYMNIYKQAYERYKKN